jgi:hypothetical protein
MTLALIGKGSSFEFRWRRWALLRDTTMNVSQTPRPQLYSIGNGLLKSVRLHAGGLAADVEAVRRILRGKSVDLLAISPQTAAVLYMGAKLAEPRPLTPAERSQVAPARDGSDLADYFSSLLDSMFDVCGHPFEDGCVEVIDG